MVPRRFIPREIAFTAPAGLASRPIKWGRINLSRSLAPVADPDDRASERVWHRRRKGSVVGVHHGECGARAYNGGMGAEPPARSRGRAPSQEVRGAKPP